MSNYIKIPNRGIQSINRRSKLTEIVVYANIRNQIKDASNIASITEDELAAICGVSIRSMWTYIQNLQKNGLIQVTGKQKGKSPYPYNIYRLEHLSDDFSMILPELLSDLNLTTEEKGLLILLKSHCHAGTNHMDFPTFKQVAEALKMDRGKLSKMIQGLKEKGYVRLIAKSLIINTPNILMFYNPNDFDKVYSIIYRFCLLKETVPPIRGDIHTFTNNIGLILEKYPTLEQLAKALLSHFKTLPPNVSLGYFCEGLCNKHYSKEKKTNYTFIL